MFILALLASVLALSAAQIITPGRCDTNVTVVDNFNIPAYTGLWYEIHRYEQFDQLAGDCVTANYTLREDGKVGVLNRMVLRGTAITISGYAESDPMANGTGKLLVTFPTVNATSPYWVLSTDYSSYALVYVCYDLSSERKQILSWVLSRSTTLAPQAVLQIDEVIRKVDGLDWNSYRETKQTETACSLKSFH